MKFAVIVAGILLVTFAVFSAAATTVSCTGTYNMGSLGDMDFDSCALNELIPGAGGSIVITNYNYYCVKVTKFYQPFSNHKINVKLLKGTTCQNWSSGEFCYNQMFLGGACNKDVLPGGTVELGDVYGAFVSYWYQSYYNAYGSNLQSFPAGMLYHNHISAFAKCGKSKVSLPTASAARTVQKKPRR